MLNLLFPSVQTQPAQVGAAGGGGASPVSDGFALLMQATVRKVAGHQVPGLIAPASLGSSKDAATAAVLPALSPLGDAPEEVLANGGETVPFESIEGAAADLEGSSVVAPLATAIAETSEIVVGQVLAKEATAVPSPSQQAGQAIDVSKGKLNLAATVPNLAPDEVVSSPPVDGAQVKTVAAATLSNTQTGVPGTATVSGGIAGNTSPAVTPPNITQSTKGQTLLAIEPARPTPEVGATPSDAPASKITSPNPQGPAVRQTLSQVAQPIQSSGQVQALPPQVDPNPTAPAQPQLLTPDRIANPPAVQSATIAAVQVANLAVDPGKAALPNRNDAPSKPSSAGGAKAGPQAALTLEANSNQSIFRTPEELKPVLDRGAGPNFLTDPAKPGVVPGSTAPSAQPLPDPAQLRAAEPALPPLAETPTASKSAPQAELTPKAPVKPFAEALMAQVKSVDVSEGKTTVNLHPRGLGAIEVEVIADKDVASKVVVRVENPAVLNALREERHLLAQTIGVEDSSVFEFSNPEQDAQADGQQGQGNGGGTLLRNASAEDSQPIHQNIVDDGALDILT